MRFLLHVFKLLPPSDILSVLLASQCKQRRSISAMVKVIDLRAMQSPSTRIFNECRCETRAGHELKGLRLNKKTYREQRCVSKNHDLIYFLMYKLQSDLSLMPSLLKSALDGLCWWYVGSCVGRNGSLEILVFSVVLLILGWRRRRA